MKTAVRPRILLLVFRLEDEGPKFALWRAGPGSPWSPLSTEMNEGETALEAAVRAARTLGGLSEPGRVYDVDEALDVPVLAEGGPALSVEHVVAIRTEESELHPGDLRVAWVDVTTGSRYLKNPAHAAALTKTSRLVHDVLSGGQDLSEERGCGNPDCGQKRRTDGGQGPVPASPAEGMHSPSNDP